MESFPPTSITPSVVQFSKLRRGYEYLGSRSRFVWQESKTDRLRFRDPMPGRIESGHAAHQSFGWNDSRSNEWWKFDPVLHGFCFPKFGAVHFE